MHVQVVTYRMTDISDAELIEANREFAEMVAAVPGLLAKVWLKDPDTGTYGGVYLWQDQPACDGFLAGELWGEAVKDESITDLASHDFAVMDELTRTTQPWLKLLDELPQQLR
jgi:Putative mono-oxygenase ydhR